MDDIIATSMKYYEKKKVNCARSVACGVLDFYKYVEASKIFYKAFTTFGGGIGEGSICGSLVGALAAMNLILAEQGLTDMQISSKAKDLKNHFREVFNTLECASLLIEYQKKDGSIDFLNPERREKCTRTVVTAVKGVQQIIDPL
ncbi:MAG: C-GCAxxG-C-C family protein [Candidatus Hodarchaeales archaeon]|jgi:C_GCAxxG_C_C family probable redox protein